MTLVQQQVEDARMKPFHLSNTFPRKSLATVLDQTIEEAQLKNASVMMAWL
jgi:hypothetical protein